MNIDPSTPPTNVSALQEQLDDALAIGHAADAELATVLAQRFPRGSSSGGGRTEYMTADERLAVTLVYEKSQLVGVEVGPALVPEDVAALKAAVSDLLKDGGTYVHRFIIFSLEPIKGWWRHGDAWAIVPAPEAAPRPPVLYAKHPAILEVRLPKATDFIIRAGRAERTARGVRLLLALLLHGQITWKRNSASHDWVLIGDDAQHMESVWAQMDYWIPGFDPVAEDFSDVSGTPMLETLNDQEYFALHGVALEGLRVPLGLNGYFEAFARLSPEDQERFLRACHWRYAAGQAWYVSRSLSFTALVSAIEALIEEDPSPPRCERCGRTTAPGPTAQFREFLEEYAPGPQTAKERAALYQVRSALSHGGKLLMGDIPDGGFGTLHPAQVEEWGQEGELSRTVRIALVNWLKTTWRRDPSAG